jgi:DNA-binding XRE family transcriptional regulator
MRRCRENAVRIVRRICGVSQKELARIVGCARLTIIELEAATLQLSPRMAEKFALLVGISKTWLLQGNPRVRPVCERDSERPFTREVFEMTRAEVLDPRTDPGDVFAIYSAVESFCAQLRAIACVAYKDKQIIYFYYKNKEFLKTMDRWKAPHPAGLTQAQFMQTLERYSREKKSLEKEKKGN